MKISVILAHPDPKSFNHAIAQTAVEALKTNGHKIIFHDLYKEKFDPLLPAKEINEDARLSAKKKALRRNRFRRWNHHYSSELVGTTSGYPQRLGGSRDSPRRGL